MAPKMGPKLVQKLTIFGFIFGSLVFEVLELFGCLLGAFMGLWSLSWEASGSQKPWKTNGFLWFLQAKPHAQTWISKETESMSKIKSKIEHYLVSLWSLLVSHLAAFKFWLLSGDYLVVCGWLCGIHVVTIWSIFVATWSLFGTRWP